MSMSHLFRLDIPFLLQLELSFCAEIIASIHELPIATPPGDTKKSQHKIQNWERTRQQARRSSKYYRVTETYFYLLSPGGKWHALKGSSDFKEPSCSTHLHFLHTPCQQSTKHAQTTKLKPPTQTQSSWPIQTLICLSKQKKLVQKIIRPHPSIPTFSLH